MFTSIIKGRLWAYRKNMCDLLKNASSLDEIQENILNFEKFGAGLARANLKFKRPFHSQYPQDLLKQAILLDFGKEIILGMIVTLRSISKEMKQCSEVMGNRLGSIKGSESLNSQNLSFFGGVNTLPVDKFKEAVSDAGSNPLVKVYDIDK